MGSEETKKIYEEYKKKFFLPEFDIVDHELEISSLDGDKFILRNIRSKIKSKIENYCNIIEDLLTPDASLALLHECSYLNEKDKKKLFTIYKKIMFMQRGAEMLDIEKKTADDANYISSYFKNLDRLKKEMKRITNERMNSWKKELSPYIKEEYFG